MIIKPNNPEELVGFLKTKPLVLYGMGDTGLRISKWCDEHGIDYIFSDKNALALQTTSEKKVITPESILNEHKDANIVVSSIVYNKEITEELLQIGIEKKRIFPYSLFMPDEVSWVELEDNKLADWELMSKRYEIISEWNWIPNEVKTVADYGAGQKFIKKYLPASSEYYPIDYIDRGDNTIHCDFNEGCFPNIVTELSVCTGTLMYVKPAKELISHICKHTLHTVIFSYVILEGFSDINTRRHSSMCNDFTAQEIMDMFSLNQFEVQDRKDDTKGNSTMSLFLFKKRGM